MDDTMGRSAPGSHDRNKGFRTRDPVRTDVRHQAAALTHAGADPNAKRTAALAGRTDRTARRWRTEGKGSPVDQLAHYIDGHPNPERILARLKAAVQRKAEGLSAAEVITEIRRAEAMDAVNEGEDTANRSRRGLTWLDRMAAADRDAADDIWLSALYFRAAVLRLPEELVYGA